MKQILALSGQLTPLLQAACKAAGLSQTELAERLDLSQSRLSAMELNPASIHLHPLLAICSALQLEFTVQTKGTPEQGQTGPTKQEW